MKFEASSRLFLSRMSVLSYGENYRPRTTFGTLLFCACYEEKGVLCSVAQVCRPVLSFNKAALLLALLRLVVLNKKSNGRVEMLLRC